jgi:hypothetical protein
MESFQSFSLHEARKGMQIKGTAKTAEQRLSRAWQRDRQVGTVTKGSMKRRWGWRDALAKVGCLEKPGIWQAGRMRPGPAPGGGRFPQVAL